MSAAHHNDTIAQLAMDALIVELLEDLLKVAGKIHCPADLKVNEQKLISSQMGNTQNMWKKMHLS